jgi:hypothetical protein
VIAAKITQTHHDGRQQTWHVTAERLGDVVTALVSHPLTAVLTVDPTTNHGGTTDA